MKFKKTAMVVAAVAGLGMTGISANAASHARLKNVVWSGKMGKHAVHYKNRMSVMWNLPASTSKKAHRVHYLKNYKHTTFITYKHMKVRNGKVYYFIKAGKVSGWINRRYVTWGEADPKVQTGTWTMPSQNQQTQQDQTQTPSQPAQTSTPTIIYVPVSSGGSTTTTTQPQRDAVKEAQNLGFKDSKGINFDDLMTTGSDTNKKMSEKAMQIAKDDGNEAGQAYSNALTMGSLLNYNQADMKKTIDNMLSKSTEIINFTDAQYQAALANGKTQESVDNLKNLMRTPNQAFKDVFTKYGTAETLKKLDDATITKELSSYNDESTKEFMNAVALLMVITTSDNAEKIATSIVDNKDNSQSLIDALKKAQALNLQSAFVTDILNHIENNKK